MEVVLFMIARQKFRILLLIFVSVGFAWVSQSYAVISHPDNEPDPTWSDKPSDDVIGKWSSNASAVAIAPNLILTTRHQGGGVGTSVVFAGETYTVVEQYNCTDGTDQVDLRVARIANAAGVPANLTEYVGVNTVANELNKTFVLGGVGKTRGAELKTGSRVYGYQWDSLKTLAWGTNRVDQTPFAKVKALDYYNSKVLQSDFDGPSDYESAIADGDSGGGWFIQSNNEWYVAGLSAYVERLDATHFRNASFGYLDPDVNQAIRVSSYSSFILDDSHYQSWDVAPGDANWDGMVDNDDLDILKTYFGTTLLESGMTWWAQGDFNSDLRVDFADYSILARNFSPGEPMGSLVVGAVPEPATVVILLLGSGAMLARARRLRRTER